MATDKSMSFELVTPEGVLIKDSVKEVFAVTEIGEIGILHDHAEMRSKLKSAPVRYKYQDNKMEVVAVSGGVLEVSHNKITILTDYAIKGKDIDEAEAEKAAQLARAELQMLSPDAKASDRDLLLAETRLQKELLKLQTARLVQNLN